MTHSKFLYHFYRKNTDRNKAEDNKMQYKSKNKDLQNLNSYDESRGRGVHSNRFEEEKLIEDE